MKAKFKDTEIGFIPEDWEKKNLGEEIELCYGKGLPKKNRIPGPYPVFGSNGIVGSHNEFLVEGPSIIIGRKGSVGEVKFSKNNFWPIDTTYYLKVKKKGSIDFWYYFLLTLKLNRMNSHSAVPGLNRDMVYALKKKIPDENEQHHIAKILSDLDSKIELLQKQNKTLEAIGQALFKHWFVDFEFPCLPSDYVLGAGKPDEMRAVCTYKSVGELPIPQQGKQFVYVLLCKNNSMYIGITDDIYRRWYEHKTGIGVKWTKANEPIKVIHYEEFDSRKKAAEREKWLKTGFGRKWLKREYDKYLKRKHGLPAPPVCVQARTGRKCQLRQAGEMVFNEELGKEIPKGWEVSKMGTKLKVILGGTPDRTKKEYWNGDVNWINSGKVNEFRITEPSEKITKEGLEKSATKLLPKGTVVLAITGATLGQVSRLEIDSCANQSVIGILENDAFPSEYLFFWIKKTIDDIIRWQTGGAQQHINKGNVENSFILMPPSKIIKEYLRIARSIFNKISINRFLSQNLSKIRDSLLPKLISGKIRVPVEVE